MTFDARERSADQGAPVELYEFRRGTVTWRYTSADRDLVVDFNTYQRATIRRGSIEQGSEMARAGLKLTVQRDLEVVQLFLAGPPSDAVTLTLRTYHEGDGELVATWSGRIVAVTPWRGGAAEVELEPVYSSLRRNGLRRHYQVLCPHVLYGAACGVNQEAFRMDAVAGQVTGATIQSPTFATQPDGYLEGGVLEYDLGGGVVERRFIFTHVGDTIELSATPVGLPVGAAVRAYPGCDHSLATCAAKFANAPNHGGMPYFPRKNPFSGDPLF